MDFLFGAIYDNLNFQCRQLNVDNRQNLKYAKKLLIHLCYDKMHQKQQDFHHIYPLLRVSL